MKQRALTLVLVLFVWAASGCNESARKPDAESEPVVGDTASVEAETAQRDQNRESVPMSDEDEFDLFEEDLEEQMVEVCDPLEGLNRIMFNFNDVVYTVVLDPVGRTYESIVCEPVRVGIDNFFQNITTPARYVNCLLQGKGKAADTELRRFWINSTEGILGFGDPALDKHGLEQVKEDLGQTLAVWGLGDGFYIVWPILGPSTLRDTVGLVGDQFLNPVRYVEPAEVSMGASALKFINKMSFHTGEYEALVGSEVDPYIAARQAYLQYRAKLIKE